MFLGSQAWEWGHFIHGDKGAIDTKTESIVHIAESEKMSSVYNLMEVDGHDGSHHHFTINDVINKLETKPNFNIRTANKVLFISIQNQLNFFKKKGLKLY